MKQAHLSQTKRYLIAILNAMKCRQNVIAITLGRSPSCISRELQRNSVDQGYIADLAQIQSEQRARNSCNAKRIDNSIIDEVVTRPHQDPVTVNLVVANTIDSAIYGKAHCAYAHAQCSCYFSGGVIVTLMQPYYLLASLVLCFW